MTGHTAALSFGSSCEVVLSADADRSKKAEKDGLGVAKAFLAFLKSTTAVAIIKHYGYEVRR